MTLTLHAETDQDLARILESYRAYSKNIKSLSVMFRCQRCGRILTKELLQLKRRPKLLCRGCYMEETYGSRNVSQREDVKKKKAETRQRHSLRQCKEVCPSLG
jgi:lysyl-tRNA synthetase class I